jgi:CheY-like chemotaxis protein
MYKGRILVVEDNMDSYELVRFILERYGYETFLAADGRDGVSATIKQKPDLILMDLAMPELDGWRATRQLKSDSRTKHIPIVAVTARALPGDRQRALDAGCDGFITKPIDLAELMGVVDKILAK